MRLPRRRFLHLSAGAAALSALPRIAAALDYPTRPVRLLTGFAAGGPSDILARLIGPWLSQRLGQAFVVENRPGAASNVATEIVLHSAADGYTLLVITSANTINASLYEGLNFNFVADAAPVAGLIRVPQVLEVHPSVPAQTVPEFIAYAKANPGKLNMASAGNGTAQHVAGELFKFMTGVDMLSGRDQVMFDTAPNSLQYLKAGTLRALAVTTATRFDGLPDVPALAEFVPGYESSAIYGVVAPKATPGEIIARLNSEINAALADPRMKERFTDLGGMVLPGTPAEFGKLIAQETEKWAKVIRAANIKPE